jgi:hypothetical protein
MYNDPLSKQIFDLFLFEKARKNAMNETLYCTNLNYALESNNAQCFRLLYCPKLKTLTINLVDANDDCNYRDYYENYSKYIKNVLQESYSELEKENDQQDEPLKVYLKRNKKLVAPNRERICMENNQSVKVNKV